MKICVIANRYRVDQFRSIVAALIDLGHDVFYWSDTADTMPNAGPIRRSILDHRFDLGISADWCFFSDPENPINRRLPGFPPFINLCFNSPFDALLELAGHRDIAGFLGDNRIWLGLLSALDHQALADFGIEQRVDLPVGLLDRCLMYGDDDRVFPVGMLSAATERARLVPHAGLIDGLAKRRGGAATPAHLVYLGAAALHVTDEIQTFCFGPMTPGLPRPFSAYIADYEAGYGFPAELSLADRQARIARHVAGIADLSGDAPRILLLRRRLAAQLERGHRLATRRARVRALQARHGDDFAVYGDDWARFGIRARPAENDTAPLHYRAAAISLDFGSLSYDSMMFPRSCDIVQAGGLLLQSRLVDSQTVLGELTPAVTFADEAEMLHLTDRWLTDPAGRGAMRAAVADRLAATYDLRQLLTAAMGQVLG